MKAFFLTEGTRTSPASRIRVYNHLERLDGRNGLRAETVSFTGESYCRRIVAGDRAGLLLRIGQAARKRRVFARLSAAAESSDLIFIQRVLPPVRVLEDLNHLNARLVYDFDDAVYSGGSGREEKFRAIMRAASKIVAVSEIAARDAVNRGAEADRVTVIPSPVDCAAYRTRKPGGNAEWFTVGWIGSPATTNYLEAIWPELAGFAAERPRVRFLFVGARPFETGRLADRVRFEPWSEQGEKELTALMDAGLMPLADDPWCRGKGAYKLIQYMAAGVPCLASPVGANREVVVEGVTGFFARAGGDWSALLGSLVSNPALCDSLGQAGRRRAESLYDYSVTTDLFHQVLVRACNGQDVPRAERGE